MEQTGKKLSTILKPLLALFISILIVVGFTYLVDIEILEFIQTRFYNPSILNTYIKENTTDAEITEDHLKDLEERFEATLNNPAILDSFLYNQRAADIFERSRIYGILLETTSGLQSVQFIDSNGIRIHYSTSHRDIISQTNTSTSYRNYNENPLALSYDLISVPAGEKPKLTMDEQTDRIIFSFPFTDSLSVYRGTALFTISVRALADRLIAEGRLKVNEAISVIADPPGILLGSPHAHGIYTYNLNDYDTPGTGFSKTDILEKVSAVWKDGIENTTGITVAATPTMVTPNIALPQINPPNVKTLLTSTSAKRIIFDNEDSGMVFSLISLRTDNGLFFGRLINDSLFSISEAMKLVLKLTIFLTIFLTLYFIFNLKPNALTLVQTRIKRLRDSLFEHLFINKSANERLKWILELEQRRDEIRKELKRNLKLSARKEKIVNEIIDKAWDELLNVLKAGSAYHLLEGDIPVVKKKAAVSAKAKTDDIDDLEEIEEIEEIEDVEELDDIEEVEALEEVEEIEELDDIEEVEALEEVEDLEADEIEALEEIEELDEVTEKPVSQPTLKAAKWEDKKELDDIIEKAIKPGKAKHDKKSGRGLLKLAESFGSRKKKGLLALASEVVPAAPPDHHFEEWTEDGTERHIQSERRGLLAAASEYDLSTDTDEQQDLFGELDIVSPFSSMFSSLEKE